MAALDFPDSPTNGQVFDRWTWNGTAWVLTVDFNRSPRGRIGYATLLTNANGFPATPTNITNLTLTWTADTTRIYRTTLYGSVNSANAGAVAVATITDGSSVQKVSAGIPLPGSGYSHFVHVTVVESGLSGSVTRKAMLSCPVLPNADWIAAANNPSFLMVEDIGAV